MPTALHKTSYSYAEYLSLENFSNVKHEFLDGQMYAMSGGTTEHGALMAAATYMLIEQLRGGPCRVYSSEVRVRTPSGLSTYPDVSVICGPIARDPADATTMTNPSLIVEVLSRSTEAYDKGEKFEHYKTFPSLRQYVLISQRDRSVEVRTREESGWASAVFGDGQVAELVIGARLNVRELYEIAAEPKS